jgi:cobalt-zinc-cadmium efflux system outer membrane protein
VIQPISHFFRRAGIVVAFTSIAGSAVHAQLPVTRADAQRAALSAGTRVALARADTAAALARLSSARALPNPSLAASYSKSVPQQHLTVDLPVFDALWKRGLVVGQASASARASRLLFASERIAAVVEVDTTYTRALAAAARFRLSRQTAVEADSLQRMTVRRRDAGDASDLDVDLATITAGQQMNTASDDSLTFMSTVLAVQVLMGIPADSVALVLTDSLVFASLDTLVERRMLEEGRAPFNLPPPLAGTTQASSVNGTPAVAAAEASLAAADLAVGVQRRNVFSLPSLNLGAEWGDPSEPGLLPTFGLSIPLPLFNRNQGPIAEAAAERERARVQLVAARLLARQRLIEGVRERTTLIAKIARDRNLVVSAQRVADRSLTAYQEGAAGLPAVLEARRSARDVLGQYIDDLAALLTINTELRALTQTVSVP